VSEEETGHRSEFEIDDEWAYRAKTGAPFERVVVLKIGKPPRPRILVRHDQPEFEGREEWVPSGRLKVAWSGVERWLELESNWERVSKASCSVDDTPEHYAAALVLIAADQDDVVELEYNRSAGVGVIKDIDRLLQQLDVDRSLLEDNPLAFVDDDGFLVVPWRVTEQLVRAFAIQRPDLILPKVDEEEAEQRRDAIHGRHYGGRNPWRVSPETCEKFYREKYGPAYALIREWCSQEANDQHDELLALRAEIRRVGRITEKAIRQLHRAGQKKEAKELERELGIPLETLHRSGGSD
jgi:hypothetical protein